jgi:prepilin-type processing-associated H-X9-DG protein
LACHNYHDAYKSFPSSYRATPPYSDGASDTTPGWGWATSLLPFVEQDNLYRSLKLNLAVENTHNAAAIQTTVKTYLCPSDVLPSSSFVVPDGFGNARAMAAPTSYAACVGGDESETDGPTGLGIFYRTSMTKISDITDGTSNTILIGERAWGNANGIWAGVVTDGVILRGTQNPCPGSGAASYPASVLVQAHGHLNNATTDTDGGLDDFSSFHTGGSNFVFADGSVRFLRSVPGDNPDGSFTRGSLALQALSTRANGESVPADF